MQYCLSEDVCGSNVLTKPHAKPTLTSPDDGRVERVQMVSYDSKSTVRRSENVPATSKVGKAFGIAVKGVDDGAESAARIL